MANPDREGHMVGGDLLVAPYDLLPALHTNRAACMDKLRRHIRRHGRASGRGPRRAALASHASRPVTPAEIAAAFSAAAPARIADWLATLIALGQARVADEGRFVAG